MSGQEAARYSVRRPRKRSGRTLSERLTLAAPRLARRVRVAVLRLPPTSPIRRALLVRVLSDVYESYNRRDWDAALAIAHPEFERHSTGPYGAIATLDMEAHSRGHEGYLRFMERWLESWEEFRLEPQEVIDFGDRVLVLVQRTGRGRHSGLSLDQPSADLFTLEGGWVVRYDDYWAREDALEPVGLRDAGDPLSG
jgi:ketosteroid isomerase-like protein